ncbi:hypothetical protein [Clostridium sp.]|uniref:hypothetical protein n=1 Tax=Clostridium sp. TaxID=1506 RepID=UPI002FC97C7B
MGVNSEFNKFIDNNITLDQGDISKKAESRRDIIDAVIKKIKEKGDCPQVYKENNTEYIHFGSYFKGTKVGNVDEFDVMLIIDSNEGIFSVGGTKKGEGQGGLSPNPKYNGNYNKEDESGISPRKIMNWLKNTIEEALDKTKYKVDIIKDGQAVTVKNEKEYYAVDFVPGGIFKDINTQEIFYIIPKGDANLGWIVTNPNIDKEIIKDKASTNSQFKNTIRLFKYLFKESYNVTISSYAVESAVVDYEEINYFWNDYSYDFEGVLNHIINLVENDNIPDMRDNEINLLGTINKQATLDKLCRIKDKYNKLDENSDDFSDNVEAFLKNE